MQHILLVDDDVQLCELLSERLREEEFAVEPVHDGLRGLERARSGEYGLVVLDLMLPRMNGIEVLRELRRNSDIPVLILTARGEDIDRIVGLEIGADDYLPKPFNPRELIARIRAILRRTARPSSGEQSLVAGDLELNAATREACISGRSLRLTAWSSRCWKS